MPANPVAENVLGTIGTVCWTIQLVPQIWKSWRSKSTEGLSEYLMLLWGLSGIFFGVYAIVQDINVPLIVQPQVLSALSYLSWAQCQYYGRKRSLRTVVLMYLAVILLSGGFEAGMIFAVQPSYNRGNKGPIDFFGAFSTVLLSVALLPQYYEIYKHKEVIGVSILFMIVDMTGGIFSDLSLAFKAKFDIVASVTYSLVIVLDAVVVLCAMILNPMAKRRRKRQALAGGDGVQPASRERPGLSMQDIEAHHTSERPGMDNGGALAVPGGVGAGNGAPGTTQPGVSLAI
ncbi:PQ-loop-domain-containing protein [Dichomitus squalens]|uniref:PQ-loop-domain-containing protein n=1 Tax=Dichomitus squalens TaxID=114155 RepID=A0A4Q9MIH9_9APHY|nr:PQ-loop-domain-containing protein [Dichomitus squalens]